MKKILFILILLSILLISLSGCNEMLEAYGEADMPSSNYVNQPSTSNNSTPTSPQTTVTPPDEPPVTQDVPASLESFENEVMFFQYPSDWSLSNRPNTCFDILLKPTDIEQYVSSNYISMLVCGLVGINQMYAFDEGETITLDKIVEKDLYVHNVRNQAVFSSEQISLKDSAGVPVDAYKTIVDASVLGTGVKVIEVRAFENNYLYQINFAANPENFDKYNTDFTIFLNSFEVR